MEPPRTLEAFYALAYEARRHYARASYDADPKLYWGVWFFGLEPHMSPMNFFAYKTRKKMGQLLNEV